MWLGSAALFFGIGTGKHCLTNAPQPMHHRNGNAVSVPIERSLEPSERLVASKKMFWHADRYIGDRERLARKAGLPRAPWACHKLMETLACYIVDDVVEFAAKEMVTQNWQFARFYYHE
jgi:hypothetical protein